jgi:hypothetical protein
MPKTSPPSTKRSRAVDLQQRPIRWAKKGHSREARLFGALRRELIAHVGGAPTAAQRALINRCAMLQTHLAQMDEKMFGQGEMSDHASRQYLAWANAVSRMLQALGLEAAPERAKSVDELLAAARSGGIR